MIIRNMSHAAANFIIVIIIMIFTVAETFAVVMKDSRNYLSTQRAKQRNWRITFIPRSRNFKVIVTDVCLDIKSVATFVAPSN